MKKIISISLLAILASCGGSSGGSGNSVQRRIENAIKSQKRGQVSKMVMTGKSRDYDYDVESETFKVTLKDADMANKSIILKITDKGTYTLTEETTPGGNLHRSVTLNVMNTDDVTNRPGVTTQMVGNTLIIEEAEKESEFGLDGESFLSSSSTRVNLTKPLCEFTVDAKVRNYVYAENGVETKLPDHQYQLVSTCGKVLSGAELKAIDLKKVEFCDMTLPDDSEEDDCKDDQDMSSLTADL